MRHSGRLACAALALAISSAGCGGLQSSLSPSVPGNPSSSAMHSARSTGDLLYVVNGRHARSVEFFTFPAGKPIGRLSNIGIPFGLCSDTAGNVWIASNVRRDAYRLYEFPHGGTMPIATIDVPRQNVATGCAVDSSNGHIAVLDYTSVLIWADAHKGKPAKFSVPFLSTACAYDDRGNLFVAGYGDGFPAYAELLNGAAKFTKVYLHAPSYLAGGVQWDGRYFAVGTTHGIFRVEIFGSKGKVVQIVRALDLALQPWIWVKGRTLVATHEPHQGSRIGVWKYPAGGLPVKTFSGFTTPLGLTVSVRTGG